MREAHWSRPDGPGNTRPQGVGTIPGPQRPGQQHPGPQYPGPQDPGSEHGPDPTGVDLSALRRRATGGEARTVRALALAGELGEPSAEAARGAARAAPIVAGVVGGLLLLVLVASYVVMLAQSGLDAGDLLVFLVLLLLAAVVTGGVVLLVRSAQSRSWRRRALLLALARANGARFEVAAPPDGLPDRLFRHGPGRQVKDVVAWPDDAGGVVCGTATAASGQYAVVHRFVVVPLDLSPSEADGRVVVALGHRDGIVQGFPPLLSRDSTRTVYATADDRRLAERVVTDDLAALLAEPRYGLDAEVADGRFVAWTPLAPDPTDERAWRHLLVVAATVRATTR
ncbi:hypothetical protein [Cellulosimicrobium marinum]|uniref:hypothetical protein n=1 Tax=Cellulosimicrobium marinum TaxID=1638992 RepID=UPI001E558ECA|nr:hypothetical protein [Cellulosimicrobium marinum]MCB7135812.1 hypothetical protein [Cellulosimicrobium marinum]